MFKKGMKPSSGKVRKRQTTETKRRKLRGKVVKMLAVMESNPESMKDPVSEFLVTGRTGRRNAMADILGPNASVTSGDLPERLQSLTTFDPETSSNPPGQPATRQQELQQQESGPPADCSTSGEGCSNNKPKSSEGNS